MGNRWSRGNFLPGVGPALVLAAGLAWPGVAAAQNGDGQFEEQLNAGLQGEGVMTISDVGDLALFGGAINVPARRPSVEQCGIYISTAPEGRPRILEEKRKEATAVATQQRYSARERNELIRRSVLPLKTCENDFKRRCEETIQKIPLKVRKAAVADVRRAVEGMLDPKVQGAVRGYLETVLRQCPLET
jgi:hypothetical protein